MRGNGGAANDAALDAVIDCRQPEKIKGEVEIEPVDPAASGALAIGGDIGFLTRNIERFEVGAGIEKKQEDFVAEVMAQVSSATPAKH